MYCEAANVLHALKSLNGNPMLPSPIFRGVPSQARRYVPSAIWWPPRLVFDLEAWRGPTWCLMKTTNLEQLIWSAQGLLCQNMLLNFKPSIYLNISQYHQRLLLSDQFLELTNSNMFQVLFSPHIRCPPALKWPLPYRGRPLGVASCMIFSWSRRALWGSSQVVVELPELVGNVV